MDSMKTSVDIPDQELKEAMANSGAKTKRDAIVAAIVEYNRSRRLRKLAEQFGTFENFITREELLRLRREP
jgi:hypothetical protein